VAASDPRSVSRRRRFIAGIAGVAGSVVLALGLPLVGFTLAVFRRQPPSNWLRVCRLDEVATDEPRLFRVAFRRTDANVPYDDARGVFVIRYGDRLLAFSNTCTHMQCPVRWLSWRQMILCPCHMGEYDRWGVLAGGPPASSLPLYEHRIDNGVVYITNQQISRGAPRLGGGGPEG
jgi:nitrite reductase/ring-hydroxylating ferredoxin subunit